jgi:hypothetical protein
MSPVGSCAKNQDSSWSLYNPEGKLTEKYKKSQQAVPPVSLSLLRTSYIPAAVPFGLPKKFLSHLHPHLGTRLWAKIQLISSMHPLKERNKPSSAVDVFLSGSNESKIM